MKSRILLPALLVAGLFVVTASSAALSAARLL
jgi:hypothetical protein